MVTWFKFQLFLYVIATILLLGSCKEKLPTKGEDNPINNESKYALAFNGTTDHIVIENIPKSIGVNSTTTAWIYKTKAVTEQQEIVGMGARQNLVVRKNGRVAIINYLAKGRTDSNLDPGYWCVVEDPEIVQLNAWVHYAGVIETDGVQTTLKLYRNGELVNQETFNYAVNGNPGCDGYIGGVHTGHTSAECYFTSPQRFTGQIDEVSMWNRSLSQSEVSDVMKRKLNHDDEGLIGYWPFEEGHGVITIDKSKFSNHAHLLYGATWVTLPNP